MPGVRHALIGVEGLLPNFLVIGAPKAATTWIADGLREHPDIYLPELKELRYFCGENFDKGQDWYESHFRKVSGEPVIGEASPSYLGSRDATRRIAQRLPQAKLIVSLRHPVEQAFSFYWHQLTRGEINLDTEFQTFFDQSRPRASYYGSHLSRYMEAFPAENLLVLLYEEDIEQRPREGMRKCYDFLDVDPHFVPGVLERKSNTRREVTAFHGVTRLARQGLRLLPREVAQPVKNASKRVLKMLPNKRGAPALDRSLRQSLLEKYYLDDIRQLEQISGRDFGVWYNA